MKSSDKSITDGLFRDNTVLSAGMVISPVIICGNTVENALALAYAFTAITLFSVFLCSFIPRALPYAVKIIIYALISSLIYIPVRLITETVYPGCIDSIGLYFPLLAVNSLIVYQTEVKFFKMKKFGMLKSLVFYIIGFNAAILLIGAIREIIGYGTVNGYILSTEGFISGVSQPFGGFVILGLLCGIYRKIRSMVLDSKVE